MTDNKECQPAAKKRNQYKSGLLDGMKVMGAVASVLMHYASDSLPETTYSGADFETAFISIYTKLLGDRP